MQGINNLAFGIISVVIFIVVAFALWNIFAPEAGRAAYTGIFGPGGLFGLLIPRNAGQHLKNSKKKGMTFKFAVMIISVIVVAAIIIGLWTGTLGGAGPASSSLVDNLFDFATGRLT